MLRLLKCPLSEINSTRIEAFLFDGTKTIHLNQNGAKANAPVGSFIVAIGGVEQPILTGDTEVAFEGNLYIVGIITGESVGINRM